jgi:hypothetical protein
MAFSPVDWNKDYPTGAFGRARPATADPRKSLAMEN